MLKEIKKDLSYAYLKAMFSYLKFFDRINSVFNISFHLLEYRIFYKNFDYC